MSAEAKNLGLPVSDVKYFADVCGVSYKTAQGWFTGNEAKRYLVTREAVDRNRLDAFDKMSNARQLRLTAGMLITGDVLRESPFSGKERTDVYKYDKFTNAIVTAWKCITHQVGFLWEGKTWFRINLTFDGSQWVVTVYYNDPAPGEGSDPITQNGSEYEDEEGEVIFRDWSGREYDEDVFI